MQRGGAYRLALGGLDLAVLAGWCALGNEAHAPSAHSLLHLFLDHLCITMMRMKTMMMKVSRFQLVMG